MTTASNEPETPPNAGTTPPSIAPGDVLMDRYEVICRLGRGGMGEVWLALDRQLNVRRAVKLVSQEMASNPRALAGLRHEAELVARLNHASIVPLRTMETDPRGLFFLVFDYVPGLKRGEERIAHLGQLVAGGRRISERGARRLLELILDGLHYAHIFRDDIVKEGIVHRDIKPSNVLLTAEGKPMLADFGIARTVQASMAQARKQGRPSGSLTYMAPEQIEGRPADARSDIYSLGVTIYELLTGRPPFSRGDVAEQHLHAEVRPIEGVSLAMNLLIQKAMAKDPGQRWQSCAEMKEALAEKPDTPLKEAEEAKEDEAARAAEDKSTSRFEQCRSCHHPNEMPYVFCDECGATRAQLGRWRVVFNLWLAMSVFLGTYSFRSFLSWDWPIYTLFSLYFVQFAYSLIRGRRRLGLRIVAWFSVFLGAGLAIGHFLYRDGAGIFLEAAADLPTVAMDSPLIFYPILAGILTLIFLPAYFRWGRKYGWVNAYRIVLLILSIVSYVLLILLGWANVAHERDLFPELAGSLKHFLDAQAHYAAAFSLAATRLGGILLLEIAVFAAVRGYAAARRVEMPALPSANAGDTGFSRSLLRLALIVRQFGVILENMATYLFHTVILLGKDLWEVFLAFVRELFVPAGALALSVVLLHRLMLQSEAYIEENSVGLIAGMIGVLLGLLCAEMLFLICKTPFRAKRVAVFHTQLIGWLLPNLLVFFLLISVLLYASSASLNNLELAGSDELPFRIGLLTKAIGAFLIVLIVIIFAKKRSLLFSPPEAAAEGSDAAPGEGGPEAEDVLERSLGKKRPGAMAVGLRSTRQAVEAGRDALQDKASTAARMLGLSQGAQRVMDSARELGERLKGRPKNVEEIALARAQCLEKAAQIKALESTRDQIAPETYESLRAQYEQELASLVEQRAQLQTRLDREYKEMLVEKKRIDDDLAQLKVRHDECEKLFQGGVIDEKEYKRRSREIRAEREQEMMRRDVCARILGFLRAEASEEPGEPSGEESSDPPAQLRRSSPDPDLDDQ
jgi:serine/threonine protein kinase